MALPATDSFTTGSNQSLTDYSANWSNVLRTWSVLDATDDCYMDLDSSKEAAARWNADTFDDDQYAKIVINAVGSGHYVGGATRCASAAATYYGAYTDNDTIYLIKSVAGGVSTLGSRGGLSVGAGDTLEIRSEGTSHEVWYNGSKDTTIGTQTDSAIASGDAGISAYYGDSGHRLDDWEGGDLGAAPADPIGFMTASIRRRRFKSLLVRFEKLKQKVKDWLVLEEPYLEIG